MKGVRSLHIAPMLMLAMLTACGKTGGKGAEAPDGLPEYVERVDA